jgi:hypothetical protein
VPEEGKTPIGGKVGPRPATATLSATYSCCGSMFLATEKIGQAGSTESDRSKTPLKTVNPSYYFGSGLFRVPSSVALRQCFRGGLIFRPIFQSVLDRVFCFNLR